MADVHTPLDGGATQGGRKVRFWPSRKLKVFLQAEASECGLACMAMLAAYHGHDVDLAGLRAKYPVSQLGLNLANLVKIASDLALSARPLRVEMEALSQVSTPCLLHWDMKHFVVLRKVTKRGLHIHDPARGARKIGMQEASDHFTGVAMELRQAPSFQAISASRKATLSAVFGSMRSLRPALSQILLAAVALEVFALAAPVYLQWVIDEVLVSGDRTLLNALTVGFVAILGIRVALMVLRSWIVAWLGAVVNVQWSTNVVGHLLRLPLAWFEKRHMGDISSRLSSVQAIQRTLTTQFVGSVLDGTMSVLTLAVIAVYSPALLFVVTGSFLLYGVTRWLFFVPLRRATENQIGNSARQVSELLEALRGIVPIKLANQQEARRVRYENAVVRTTNQDVAVQRLTIGFSAANELVSGVMKIALVFLAAHRVMAGTMTAGALVAIVAYADQFALRASALVDKGADIAMLRLHAERLADIVMEHREKNETGTWGGRLDDMALEVRNLGFRFSEHTPWLFRNQNFTVTPGQMLAITGPSGCGKTTLAKIILGLILPTEGQVLFGGVTLDRLGLERYRDHVAAVMQDDQLFAGSIRDNITFGTEDTGFDHVIEAATAAAIDKDISAMPLGYNTNVGDMGSSLSGGQKQRVILARALYRKPKLLVLDEATSHLDIEGEAVIARSVASLDIARVIIAHRPQTISSADCILDLGNNNHLGTGVEVLERQTS